MKPHVSTSLFPALAFGVLSTLYSCDKSTAGGSDEIDTRVVVNTSGTPVAGARIVLVRSGDSTGQAQAISSTAANGSFPDFQVPDGYYSMVVRDPGDSLGKYLDSVPVAAHKLPKGRDTLRALGRIRGVVRMGAGDSPATAVVGLIGTDILANVKADGTFSVELVPGGLYTLSAGSSLPGYGTLYQRLSLKNGQDTLLSDTLVLPFAALPTPAGLRVVEDTATGNIGVSWNRVQFPDLLGYVLERVENGSVTVSQYLTDTTWTDSLGTYWESQPLLGPWPARNLAYRVRSRSVSGNPDSRSNAQTFQAVAPNWTKRVDSVKVTLVVDTVKGIARLTWNTPAHPDLLGWTVTRSVDGVQDCAAQVATGTWNDSICPDPTVSVVGGIHDRHPVVISYSVQAKRRLGVSTSFSPSKEWNRNITGGGLPLIEWRDSLAGMGSNVVLNQVGDWMVWSDDGGVNRKISHDGVTWENLPMGYATIAAQGDSIWNGTLVDSLHYDLASRTGPGTWVVNRIELPIPSSNTAWGVLLSVVGDLPTITWLETSGWHSFSLSGGVPKPIVLQGIAKNPPAGPEGLAEFQLDSGSRLEIGFGIVPGANVRWSLVDGDSVSAPASSGSLFLDAVYQGAFRKPAILLGGFGMGSTEVVQLLSGIAWVVHPPTSTGLGQEATTVFHDEIWAIVDGHLWKGKLNLPASP